jgi:hypothetical protein
LRATTKRLYWQLTALLLVASFMHWPWGLPLAWMLSGLQVVHSALARRGNGPSLELQVRLVFFGLLALGTLPGLRPLHLLQFAGLNAIVVADYCVLARLLTLLPWNRSVPLSWALVGRVLLLPPAPGPITSRLGPAPSAGR